MVVAISLGAVHTHTHTHTHTGRRLNNHILSCSKVNNKILIDM